MLPHPRREWIVQKCNNAFRNDYEAWPGYDRPITREQMIEALDECDRKWPVEDHHEAARDRQQCVITRRPESSGIAFSMISMSAQTSPLKPKRAHSAVQTGSKRL